MNGHIEVIKYLVDKGAFVEAENTKIFKILIIDRETPLILASSNGNFEIVKYLADKGGNIETRNIEK